VTLTGKCLSDVGNPGAPPPGDGVEFFEDGDENFHKNKCLKEVLEVTEV
jgi:hypothetical protein